MHYHRPTSIDEALALIAAGPVSVIAGGTDWFPAHGVDTHATSVLDLTRIAELRGIARQTGGWLFGAATTWTDVLRADLPRAFDGLKAAAREVGSVQIQNAGTIAGNICNASPAADGVPPLLTLDAEVRTAGPAGRRRMPLSEFATGVRRTGLAPAEIVTGLFVPDPEPGTAGAFRKLGARRYLVISIAMVAALVRMDSGRIAWARIAVGACSPVAQRLPDVEAEAIGQRPDDLRLTAVPARLAPIDDVRATAAYRADAVAQLCREALQQAAEGAA